MTRLSHHAKSKVGRRRSQQTLKKLPLTVCANCKAPTFSHRVCPQCGTYKRVAKSKGRRAKSQRDRKLKIENVQI